MVKQLRGRQLPDGKRKFGWIPDVPDHRDLIKPLTARIKLPSLIDLRLGFPGCYDQGQLGSCTANATAGLIQYNQLQESIPSVMPSRLFLYYTSRLMEGTVEEDSGATIRDSIKAAAKGYCSEEIWPYLISKFDLKPTTEAYKAAKAKKIKYQRVSRTLYSLKACLAKSECFSFGFSVYESFMSDMVAKSGLPPMPTKKESLLGGHAVVCCGYDPRGWICRNSWGVKWGASGYFIMPYVYLMDENLSDDFWSITLVN
jgi:C1A family cysteine protease